MSLSTGQLACTARHMCTLGLVRQPGVAKFTRMHALAVGSAGKGTNLRKERRVLEGKKSQIEDRGRIRDTHFLKVLEAPQDLLVEHVARQYTCIYQVQLGIMLQQSETVVCHSHEDVSL